MILMYNKIINKKLKQKQLDRNRSKQKLSVTFGVGLSVYASTCPRVQENDILVDCCVLFWIFAELSFEYSVYKQSLG